MVKKLLRSKTFTTGIKGKGTGPGFKKAYTFLNQKGKRKGYKKDDVWMESYGVGKNRRIMRAVVYYKVKKK